METIYNVQHPGDIKEINTAKPRICQTDFAGFIAGTSTTNTLFHKYFPKNNSRVKIKNTVKNDTIARRPEEAETDSIRPLPSNVSVCEKAAFNVFAITPPIMFLS